MRKICLTSLLVISLLVGCRDSSSPTLVIVNGQPITARQVKEQVLVQAKISEFSGKPISTEGLAKEGDRLSVSVLQTILCSTLIQQELDKTGQIPESSDTDRALDSYNKLFGSSHRDVDGMARMFGDLEVPFKKFFEMEVAVSFYERKFWFPKVTDRMVVQRQNLISNELSRIARINECGRKAADEAYARLKRGEKWTVVAKRFSEDKLVDSTHEKYSSHWLTVGPTAIGIKQLARKLPTMEKGDFTEPIETNEGLMIVRLERCDGELYRLSRIFFRMGKDIRVPRNAEEVRRGLEQSMLMRNRQNTLTVLWKSARLEYPMGTNFTYSIWSEK